MQSTCDGDTNCLEQALTCSEGNDKTGMLWSVRHRLTLIYSEPQNRGPRLAIFSYVTWTAGECYTDTRAMLQPCWRGKAPSYARDG